MTGCFIIPPSPFLLDERVFPSLGVLKVAAMMEAQGEKVRVLDLSGVEDYLTALDRDLASNPAPWYGITATTPQLPAAFRISKRIQETQLDARIVLGGAHVTMINAAARREAKEGREGRATEGLRSLWEMAEVLVAGDGELAMKQALEAAPGTLLDVDDPSNPLFLGKEQLESSPWPARHLIDLGSYHAWVNGRRATSVVAQLGCPFGCGFCGGRLSPSYRRVRLRSSSAVVREIEHLITTYGLTAFMFQDDELNVRPEVVQLMDEISWLTKRLRVELRLRGFIKSQLLTDEQAVAMKRAGFHEVLVGFESGDERILKNIQKKATRDENTRCVEILKKNGIRVKALMSVGHPGESPETIRATRDWLLEVGPEEFDVTVITVYPGTPYYDHAIQSSSKVWTYSAPSGDRLHAVNVDYRETPAYYKGIPGSYRAYVYSDHITMEELARLRDQTETEVRGLLEIPWPVKTLPYEHSMGQGVVA